MAASMMQRGPRRHGRRGARPIAAGAARRAAVRRSLSLLALVALASLSARANAQAAAPPPQKTPEERAHGHILFIADPLSDGAVLSLALGIGALSELILGTEEIRPQAPGDPSMLLGIDRNAVNQTPDRAWGTVSRVGLATAVGIAVIDPIATTLRHELEAGVVDALIYGQTLSITWSTTNLTKLAVRRPRPSAYREARRLRAEGVPERDIPDLISDTNSALSFFSGHASVTAAVTATASYLAFSRSPGTARPWITLGVGTVFTGLTCVARVRSGEHFPTDVIAGAMVGFGIGILVPHSHRADFPARRPVLIGAAPLGDGGLVTLAGQF